MDIKELFTKVKESYQLFGAMQKQLENEKVEGSAGASLVKVTVNGLQEITDIDIDPQLIRMKDKKLLQDLIKSAANQAKDKANELSQNLLTRQLKENAFNIPDILSEHRNSKKEK